MRDHTGLEVVADNSQCNAAKIFEHMNIAVDPGLLIHVQAGLNICKLAVRKYSDKEVYRIYLTFFRIGKPHCFTAPVHFAYNTGLVRDMAREVVLLDILSVVFAEFRVSYRNAIFHAIFVLRPQQFERDTDFLQFTVYILISSRL